MRPRQRYEVGRIHRSDAGSRDLDAEVSLQVHRRPPSYWDTEWFYHLPFPLISVEWLDVALLQETQDNRLPPRIQITDHSPWLEELLQRVGLEYQKGSTMIRIFGYSPKSLDLFDLWPTGHNLRFS